MTRINLLPPEERAKAAREQGLVLVVLGIVVLVVVLSAVYLLTFRQVSGKQDKIDAADAEIAKTTEQISSLSNYQSLQEQRDQMQTVAKEIFDSRVVWSSILEEVSLVIPETCCLKSFHGLVLPSQEAGSAIGAASSAATAESPSIQLVGEAKTQKDVAEFMTRLGLMPQLVNVTLKQSTYNSSTAVYTFEIDAYQRPFLTAAPNSVGGATAPAPAPTTTGG